jgi:extracellular solute-binding protein family 1
MAKTKKTGLLAMAAILAAASMTGCGNTGAGNTTSQAKDSTPAAESKTQESTKEESKEESKEASKEVTLKFLGFKTGQEEGALPEIIKDFETAHPGVTVEYEAIPTTANYNDVLSTRMSSGEGPDVFMCHIDDVKPLVDVGYVEDLAGQPWMDTILDEFKTASTYKGTNYILPIESSGIGMFVNKTVLDACGAEVPTVWSEFEEAAGKVKDAGKMPLIMGNKTGWSAAIFCTSTFESNYTADSDVSTRLVDGDTDYVKEYGPVLNKLYEVVKNDWTNSETSLGMEFDDAAVAEYAKGESAFMLGGTWQIATVKEAAGDAEILFAPIPTHDDKVSAKLMAGTCLAVNAASEEKDLALEFLSYFADDAQLSRWVESQSAFTTLKGGTSTQEAGAELFAQAVADGKASLGPKSDDRLKADMWTAITKEVQMILLGQEDGDTAAANLQAEFEKGQSLQ